MRNFALPFAKAAYFNTHGSGVHLLNSILGLLLQRLPCKSTRNGANYAGTTTTTKTTAKQSQWQWVRIPQGTDSEHIHIYGRKCIWLLFTRGTRFLRAITPLSSLDGRKNYTCKQSANKMILYISMKQASFQRVDRRISKTCSSKSTRHIQLSENRI